MTTLSLSTTLADLGPVLVSELPPAAARVETRPGRWTQRRAGLRAQRRFEKALRAAAPQELSDLLAQDRAQRTLTDTRT